jgi:ADP-heptose:LPS heptosyltransferase
VSQRLLFVESFKLGDLVYLGALVAEVRAQLPEAEIVVLGDESTRDFPFLSALNVERVSFAFPWNRMAWHRRPDRVLAVAPGLRAAFGRRFRDFDALDARGDVRHRMVLRTLQPLRLLSYRAAVPWHRAIRGIHDDHAFQSRQHFYEQLVGPLGLRPGATLRWPWLGRPSAALGGPPAVAGSRDVLLSPGASNALRLWAPDRWARLARRLADEGWRTTLVAHGDADIPADRAAFQEIWRGSIADLAQRLAGAALLIAVDSFAGHLGAAAGVPVVSLFGPQAPARWRPWGNQTEVVIAGGFACRPCGQKRCVRPESSCMDAIDVEMVMAAVHRLAPSTIPRVVLARAPGAPDARAKG